VALSSELVREVAAASEIALSLSRMEIRTHEEACQARFLGSPTIRVDGQDIESTASIRDDFGLKCRLYGGVGTPPRRLIETALAGRERS
jgi:hypothetical protein